MLIIITDDILKDFSKDLLPADQNTLIEQIISSHLMGFHFVYGSEKALKYLSVSKKLSQGTRAIYNYIYNNRSTFEPNIIKLQKKVIISNEVQTILSKTDGIYINLSYLSRLNILEKFKLISEDIDDCTFYFSIADNLIKRDSKLIKLSYDPINGGGDRTKRNFFDRAISHQNISYTILDSDKKFDKDVEGETSRKVIRLYERFKNKIISTIYVLDVHEKENLIPSSIYSCFNGDKGVSTILSEISRIPELIHYLKFLDLKEGLHSVNYNPYYDNLIKYLFENSFVGESFSTFENT
ncbi:hypothetical protein, partial [Lysinibacillus sp. LK3]|uniref:hypothetical protein n=1 Tax=Lysinibacillus sp. LK3 TaxID=1628207 RepID=UPI00065461CB